MRNLFSQVLNLLFQDNSVNRLLRGSERCLVNTLVNSASLTMRPVLPREFLPLRLPIKSFCRAAIFEVVSLRNTPVLTLADDERRRLQPSDLVFEFDSVVVLWVLLFVKMIMGAFCRVC